MRKYIFASLFTLAVISGVFWSTKMWGHQETKGDDYMYKGIARDILERGTYTLEGKETNIEPLYPFFLAGIFAVFGYSHDAVRIIQILLFATTVTCIYALCLRITSRSLALVIAVLCALFYGLAAPAGALNRETLLIFFTALLALLLQKTTSTSDAGYPIYAGIVTGFLTLTNASFQFLFLPVLAVMYFLQRKTISRRDVFLKISLFLVAFALTMSPWVLRNIVRESADPVAARKGLLLLRKAESAELLYQDAGLNLLGYAFGYYFAERFDDRIVSRAFSESNVVENREQELLKQGKSYGEIDAVFTKEAIGRILAAPQKYVYAILINFIHLNNSFIPDKDDWGNSQTILLFAEGRHASLPYVAKVTVLLGIRLVWLIFFGLILYAIGRNSRDWQKYAWPLLLILYINGIYSLVHGIPRFALPIYPFYILFFALGLTLVYQKYFHAISRRS